MVLLEQILRIRETCFMSQFCDIILLNNTERDDDQNNNNDDER